MEHKTLRNKIKHFLKTEEGKVLLFAFGGTIVLFAIIAIIYMKDEPRGVLLLQTLACHLSGLRAGGVLVCLNSGMNKILTFIVNMIFEALIIFWIYPLFVFMAQDHLKIKFVKRAMEKVRKKAEAHENLIKSYGVIGLALFVMLPFQMTGPIIGSMLGYLMGYSMLKNFSCVLGGTAAAVLAYTLLGHSIVEKFKDSELFKPILISFIAIFMITNLLKYRKGFFSKEKPTPSDITTATPEQTREAS